MTTVATPVHQSRKGRAWDAVRGLPRWVRGSRPLRGWLPISLFVARALIVTVGIALAIWIAVGMVGVLDWAIRAVIRLVMELIVIAAIIGAIVIFFWIGSKAKGGSNQPVKPQAPPPPPSLRQSLAPADNVTASLPFAALPTATKKARLEAANAAEASPKKR